MTKLKDIPRSGKPKALKDFLNKMEALGYGNLEMKKGPTGNLVFDTAKMPPAQLENLKADAFKAAQPARVDVAQEQVAADAQHFIDQATQPRAAPAAPPRYTGPAVSPDIAQYLTSQPYTPSTDYGAPGLGIQAAPPAPAPGTSFRPGFGSPVSEGIVSPPGSLPGEIPSPDRFAGTPDDYLGTPTSDRFGGTPTPDPNGVGDRLRQSINQLSLPSSAPTPSPAPRPDMGGGFAQTPNQMQAPSMRQAPPASVPAAIQNDPNVRSFTPSPDVTGAGVLGVNGGIGTPSSGVYADPAAYSAVANSAAASNPRMMSPNTMDVPSSLTPITAPNVDPFSFAANNPIAKNVYDTPALNFNYAPGFQPPATPDEATVAPDVANNLVPDETVDETLAPLPPPVNIPPTPKVFTPDEALDEASPPASMPSPSLSVSEVYNGTVGMAASADGKSFVSRDPYGTTSVTNQYGKTTAMTPGGYQSAYGGGAGVNALGGGAFGDRLGGENFGGFDNPLTGGLGSIGKGIGEGIGDIGRGIGSLFGGGLGGLAKRAVGLDPNQSFASQKHEFAGQLMGSLVGGVGGSMLGGGGGLIGAIGGGYYGGKMGKKSDFPDKPSSKNNKSGVPGGAKTKSERASISPAASASIDRGDPQSGLW